MGVRHFLQDRIAGDRALCERGISRERDIVRPTVIGHDPVLVEHVALNLVGRNLAIAEKARGFRKQGRVKVGHADAPGQAIVFAAGFRGALEELYLKNVTTENRLGYMYADQNRRMGTYLLDLTSDSGRARFAALLDLGVPVPGHGDRATCLCGAPGQVSFFLRGRLKRWPR